MYDPLEDGKIDMIRPFQPLENVLQRQIENVNRQEQMALYTFRKEHFLCTNCGKTGIKEVGEEILCKDCLKAVRKIHQQENPKGIPVRSDFKIGRNELCPCGSGVKYKQCCLGSKQI